MGPLHFNIFIKDLTDCILYFMPYLYADDFKIKRVIELNTDILLLQSNIDRLLKLCSNNNMELIVEKNLK